MASEMPRNVSSTGTRISFGTPLQGQAKHHREEQDWQQVSPSHGGEDVVGYDAQDQLHEAMLVGSCLLKLSDVRVPKLGNVCPDARLKKIAKDQSQDDGDGRDDFEVHDGLESDAA